MHYTAVALFAASLVLTATTSFAQGSRSPNLSQGTTGQNTGQGTPEERAACRSSARRYCRDAGDDSMRVLYCLQEHRAQLTRSCRTVLERNGQL